MSSIGKISSNKPIDITNHKFGKLTALCVSNDKSDRAGVHWLCQCECGNTKICACGDLRGGHISSCGCMWKSPPGHAARKEVHKHYIRGAKRRGHEWGITYDYFCEYTQKHCYYCGIAPKQKASVGTKWSCYLYNGLDRIDNKLGYVPSNIVTCCRTCNFAKGKMSSEDFIKWVEAVFDHSVYKNLSPLPERKWKENEDGNWEEFDCEAIDYT